LKDGESFQKCGDTVIHYYYNNDMKKTKKIYFKNDNKWEFRDYNDNDDTDDKDNDGDDNNNDNNNNNAAAIYAVRRETTKRKIISQLKQAKKCVISGNNLLLGDREEIEYIKKEKDKKILDETIFIPNFLNKINDCRYFLIKL
jgi:hypothetical protein